MNYKNLKRAIVLLEDGTIFEGKSVGIEGSSFGEVCYNTGMTGYQEIFTDPSYSGQLMVTTNAHIGNYGINDTEVESDLSYDNFTLADIDNTLFSLDQRSIGSSWRNSGGPNSSPSLKDNVFYIVSDTDANLYKLKFLALFNEAGERGYPEFVYSLLQ